MDTSSRASLGANLSDSVWGEPSYPALWDDIGNDIFVFSSDLRGDDDFSELHAGDRLDLGWESADLTSTLTLVIGPTFTGAGQLVIHANGHQTYIESDLIGSGSSDQGTNGAGFLGTDGGGGDC